MVEDLKLHWILTLVLSVFVPCVEVAAAKSSDIELEISIDKTKKNPVLLINGEKFELSMLPKGTALYHWGAEEHIRRYVETNVAQKEIDYLMKNSRGSYGGGMYFSTIPMRYKGYKKTRKYQPHQFAVLLKEDRYVFDLDKVQRALRDVVGVELFRFTEKHREQFKKLGISTSSFISEYIFWDNRSFGHGYYGGVEGIDLTEIKNPKLPSCNDLLKKH